jgi:myo-inositol catabolism protein IolC
MNNQKDTQKTSLNSYGQGNVLDVKTLGIKHVYEFANKKTEKLVTALYMVTDCMDTDDALKSKLRELGVELLSDMYKLSNLSPQDKHVHISTSLARIDEVLSFVEIAYTIGFISEMNTMILKKEFLILIGELESLEKKDKHFTFTLDKDMFSLPENSTIQGQIEEGNIVKDKKTNFNNMSFTNTKNSHSAFQISKTNNHVHSVSEKKDRTDRILALVKDKDVSIKDISNSFTDCSEKTIQRELNTLVLKGQIKKTGSKRWSRYMLVESSK